MAQISFNDIPETTTNNENSVDFFNLANDGDEAIVRIMHDDVSSFKLFTVHERISVNGKMRKVNCIRNPKDPIDMCPLCKAGYEVKNKIFINMIRYITDDNGLVIAKPVIWERSLSYATKLKNLIDEYGPLSECVFKIKRNGARGSMDTTYDIFFCNPKTFNETTFPIIDTPFATYSALGTIILDKSFEEMSQYVTTGNFPDKESSSETYVPKSQYTQNMGTPINQTNRAPWDESAANSMPEEPNVTSAMTGSWPGTPNNANTVTPGRPSARYY